MRPDRRKIVLSILGAGIVLITFVGKEIFKESYKDKLSDLASTQRLLISRRDLFESVKATQEALNKKRWGQNTDLREDQRLTFDRFMEEYREDSAASDAIKDALKDTGALKELTDEQVKLQVKLNAASNDLIIANNNIVSETAKGHIAIFEATAFAHACFAVENLNGETTNLLGRMTEELERQHLLIQRKYDHFRNLSYFLFGVGWIMNLAGTVWKIDGLKTSGE